MAGKKQTTFAKLSRELAVQEKRARKLEKKRLAAEAKAAAARGEVLPGAEDGAEAGDDEAGEPVLAED
jgi:hypothetical protein